ncbi:MFS transporter [Prodigiosinella confusarubida]|uniref:Bcr/CflA family efflux transporter n=1 Tax=Serratia sp. (strain ATCC 39006) TaxID=104623 RepID=A0A2I5TBQ2_SERS3|nr:multidrug effflux MFS transporter [Serratia sp. ATCC 39006]AUH02008.1 MFS transporter [Serratia sp. ATCC 39006]AUH06330.1 MFS transporter [Serratia sp. ATCC 39006]
MSTNKRYENFIVFLAPLINSVGGIAIDLYAPSLPSIGREFGTSAGIMQSTITITLIFYAIGQLFFGILSDSKGRKASIVSGLLLFLAGSVLAVFARNIETLLVARAIQGFAIGACQVVARALLVDNVKGPRFGVAIIYLSLAFGLGPVIAPFIGGKIEVFLGWRYNFVLYSLYGAVILAFVMYGLKESLTRPRSPLDTIKGYKFILSDARFISSVVIIGGSFSAFLMWNVIGPYIIQQQLGLSADFFGTTALTVGIAYLTGTLANRALVNRFHSIRLMKFGYILFALGIVVISSSPSSMTLWSVLGGIILIAFGQGFIFSNAMAKSMSLFPDRAGIAASLQGCLMLVFGSLSSAVASYFPMENNSNIATLFMGLLALSLAGLFILLKSQQRVYANESM